MNGLELLLFVGGVGFIVYATAKVAADFRRWDREREAYRRYVEARYRHPATRHRLTVVKGGRDVA